MALPRYVINYDELVPFVQQAISEAEIKIKSDNLEFTGASEIQLDTTKVKTLLDGLLEKNQSINDIINKIKSSASSDIANILEEKFTKDTEIIDGNIEKLQELLDVEKKITAGLEEIKEQLNPLGDQRVKGFYEFVPPVVDDFKITFKQWNNIHLTGLTISQIGWKKEDTYSLIVDDEVYVDKIYTKEVAEKKRFNRYIKVPAGKDIVFVLHNNSGNSRQLWVDIEYIVKSDEDKVEL